MAQEYAPNTLDGPPPAKLKKASTPPDKDLPVGIAKNPATSAMIGMKMVEQGLQLMMGAMPDLTPALALALQELKKLSITGVAALSTSGPTPPPGMGGQMGQPPMAAGMAPPGMPMPMEAPAPAPGGMPIPPGV